ncbi:MAG: ABC transporter permease [Terracidiphilus sp.]
MPGRIVSLFRNLLRKKTVDRALDDEIQSSVELLTEEKMSEGLSRSEARRQALIELGGVEQVRTKVREVWAGRLLEEFAADVRFGWRQLRKHPGFTLVAMLTMALGLAVNATIFSLIDDLFLRPLPAKDPQQLVVLSEKSPKFQYEMPFSYPDYKDLREAIEGGAAGDSAMARAFSGLIAYKEQGVHLSRTGASTERAWVHLISDNYFDVLGAKPYLGRLLLPGEGKLPSADPIIVLTYDCWRTRFGADPSAIGQTVKVNGHPLTVVGVTEPGFYGAEYGTALGGFVPASMYPLLAPEGGIYFGRGDTAFFMMGRMRQGVRIEQSRATATAAIQQLFKQHPDNHVPVQILVRRENMSRPSPYVAAYAPMIVSALMTLALLVLVVATANIANLLYVRAAGREQELAIRGALGASRWRLIRQLTVESGLLALGAGLAGTAAGLAIGPHLVGLVTPSDFAPGADTGWDWRTPVFTFAISIVFGMLAGLAPALRASRFRIQPLLKDGSPSAGRSKHPLRSLMVVGQVAAACVVIVCAGLTLRGLHKLSRIDLGLRTEGIFLASFDLDMQHYNQQDGRKFQESLLRAVRVLPGVQSASLAEHAPFDTVMDSRGDVSAEGTPHKSNPQFDFNVVDMVDCDFLNTVGIPLVEGRQFRESDNATAPPVVIINRTLAERLWPGTDAVGKRLIINENGRPIQVVGVTPGTPFYSVTDRARTLLFLPIAQNYAGKATLIVHSMADPKQLGPEIQQVVRHLDPDLPLNDLRTMDQQLSSSPNAFAPMRMGAVITGAQSAVALLLAALGIFGLASFAVTQRTREIGVRIAFGAKRSDVFRIVIRNGMRLTAIGLGIGTLLSLALSRVLTGLLYGIRSFDLPVFASAMLFITAIMMLACWLPARRAASIEPMQALRNE